MIKGNVDMLQVMHKVFLLDGEEWVANSLQLLTSIPPKYNAYRISDKKHAYLLCDTVHNAETVRFMDGGSLYLFLNPNTKIITQSGPISFDAAQALTGPVFTDLSPTNILRPSMTVEEAMFVESLRIRQLPCTFRRVSELVAEKYPHLVPKDAIGHQWQGEELIDTAFRLLEGMEVIEAAKDPLLQHLLDKWYI